MLASGDQDSAQLIFLYPASAISLANPENIYLKAQDNYGLGKPWLKWELERTRRQAEAVASRKGDAQWNENQRKSGVAVTKCHQQQLRKNGKRRIRNNNVSHFLFACPTSACQCFDLS